MSKTTPPVAPTFPQKGGSYVVVDGKPKRVARTEPRPTVQVHRDHRPGPIPTGPLPAPPQTAPQTTPQIAPSPQRKE